MGDSRALSTDDWRYIAKTLLSRFVTIVEPLPPHVILGLARCSELSPAMVGESSFCIQLRDDGCDDDPAAIPADEIRHIRGYEHEVPIRFDGDDFHISFEEAIWPGEVDPYLQVSVSWEAQVEPPYKGFPKFPPCRNAGRVSTAFTAIRTRMHCWFADPVAPVPQLTDVFPADRMFFRTAFGEIPNHVCQGDGSGIYLPDDSHFASLWRELPSRNPIFAFVHLHSYRSPDCFRRIVKSRHADLDKIFAKEEARLKAPSIGVMNGLWGSAA